MKNPKALGIPAEVRDKIVKQMPMGRIGTPEDVAAAVEFLASAWIGFHHRANPRRRWRSGFYQRSELKRLPSLKGMFYAKGEV